MNLFRCGTPDGRLDKKYLRVCSIYKLLARRVIDKSRALELLAQRHSPSEMRTLRGTVDLWCSPAAIRAREATALWREAAQ